MKRKPIIWAIAGSLALSACSSGGVELGTEEGLTFSSYTVTDIIKAGGNVVVSADQFSSYTLMDFAKAASQSGAQITITNANSLSSYTVVDIAKTAPGRVTFKN